MSALSLKRGPENAPKKTQLAFSDDTTGTIHKCWVRDERLSCLR